MKKLSVGTKVRCISGDRNIIEPGTILTIRSINKDLDLYYFEGVRFSSLHPHEIEPLNRTIRDVVIGDTVTDVHNAFFTIIDVGKNGIVNDHLYYWTFEALEKDGFTIKQPEQEKQEIEIARVLLVGDNDICENRNLIIELQKLVNKIVEE